MGKNMNDIQKAIDKFISFGNKNGYVYEKISSQYNWFMFQTKDNLIVNNPKDDLNMVHGFLIYSDDYCVVLCDIVNVSPDMNVLKTEILSMIIPKSQIVCGFQSYNCLLDNPDFKDKIGVTSDGVGFNIATGQSIQPPVENHEEFDEYE
jgi:hypothetical protein